MNPIEAAATELTVALIGAVGRAAEAQDPDATQVYLALAHAAAQLAVVGHGLAPKEAPA